MASAKISCFETASNSVMHDRNFISSGEPRISIIGFSLAAMTRRVRAGLPRRMVPHGRHRRFPGSPLLRPQSSGLALAVEAGAERDLFWPIARYVSGTNAEAVDPGLHVDRAALRGKRTPTIERLKAVARSEYGRIEAQLPMVASMLSVGGAGVLPALVGLAETSLEEWRRVEPSLFLRPLVKVNFAYGVVDQFAQRNQSVSRAE